MEIRGPNNAHRSDVDRAKDSRKADRLKDGKQSANQGDDAQVEGDRVDTSASQFIDRSVTAARRGMQQRAADIKERREELLARADDPEAIRRAAEGFLKAAKDIPSVFD